VVSSTPRPQFTPGKDSVPIVEEAGWAPGPVWTGGKSRPHRDSIPDRPARSSVAIPTELPGLCYEGHFTNKDGSIYISETLPAFIECRCRYTPGSVRLCLRMEEFFVSVRVLLRALYLKIKAIVLQ